MKQLFTLVLALLSALTCAAQEKKKCLVTFGVSQEVTYEKLNDAKITLLLNDSVVPYTNIQNVFGTISLEFKYRPGLYTLKAEKEGYEPGFKQFKVNHHRNGMVGAGTILLKKERNHTLKEVTIRPTHIKMVMRGDTVVYDAAAFDLAEGSMLDALVQQLPGAELRNGQILVNGKFIESLMINGEDFFAGNPSVALQNLPAYTVKNIKVYDRADKDDYLKGEAYRQMDNDEHMVMDVILKKAYATGWLGNVEGGYGLPHNKYQGKLFGMGYTGRLRMAAFANVNNIKDTQSGSSSGSWGGGWPQDGELDLAMGGLDVLYSKDRMKYQGNVTLTHEEADVENKTSTVNFYNTGDVYGRALSLNRDRKFHLMSSHSLEYTADRVYATLKPSLDYLRNDFSRLNRRADLTENPVEAYRLEALDSLFGPNAAGSRYADILLNRQNRASEGVTDWVIAGATANATISLPNLGDYLEFRAGGNYRRDTNSPATAYTRIYGDRSEAAGTGEHILQQTDYVSKNYTVNAGATYSFYYMPYRTGSNNVFILEPAFDFSRNHNDHANTLYQLSEPFAGGNGQTAIILPSAVSRDRLAVDLDNTYHSVHTQDYYRPGFEAAFAFVPSIESGKQYTVSFGLNDNMQREHLDYRKAGADTTLTRFAHNLRPKLKLSYRLRNDKQVTEISALYAYSEGLPALGYMINTVNSGDPENIYVNNDELNRSRTHNVNFSLSHFMKQSHRNLTASLYYTRTDRAIANTKYYDRNTGVNTWRPENIDGNWNTGGSVGYTMPFGKGEAFQLSTNTGASFVNSVDYASESADPVRSVVKNLSLSEHLGLSCRLGRHTLGWQGNVSLLRSRSEAGLFEAIDAVNFGSGVNGMFNFPHDWQLGTDLTLYCRRGYTDETLNTTNWVWNASIAKSVMKGNLTFKLNGADILGQISNVQHSVNAQGRTETWVNTVSRYVMLHVIWRFNIIPKKKTD